MEEIKAPNKFKNSPYIGDVFLAGSIEMGTASDWQKEIISEFEDTQLRFLNPRREAWDSSWEQSITNPHFNEQVNWELDALDYSDLIVFYFDPSTKSPISLMELGLFAASGKCMVCCPNGFWRKGNIEIICNRFKIPLFETKEELISAIKQRTKFWKF